MTRAPDRRTGRDPAVPVCSAHPPPWLPDLRRLFQSLAVLVLLAGCTGSGCSGSAPDAEAVLHRGVGPEPESLDPHTSRTTQAFTVQRDLFEGLTGYTSSGELVDAAAARRELSDDGLTYTFGLRPEGRWSNGDPLTAADFVASFRRLVDPATAAFYAEHLSAIENAGAIVAGNASPAELGVRATGPLTLEIRLERPVPYFPQLLALPGAYPVHRESLERHGEGFTRAGNLISNGAYRLARRELGAFIELERNPHYRAADTVAIPRVRHHVTVEPGAELSRYRAGELHVTQTIPPESFALLAAERPDELKVAPMLGTYFYGFNLSKPKLADEPALRRALSMAIDRDVLTEKVTARGERPARSWVPPGVDNYAPARVSWADMPAAERIATARRLYRTAGYGPDNPLELEIRYNTAETHQKIALAIQAMWKEVLGFEATLVNEEFRVLVANIREADVTEVFRLSWNGDYNDAATFLSIFESGNPSNLTGYSNDEFDSLMQSAARQLDPAARRANLELAEQVMLGDNPVIPLYFHVSKHLVSPRVTGWEDNVLDIHLSQHLSLSGRAGDD